MLRISDPREQERVWRKVVKDELSVRAVEQMARKIAVKTKETPQIHHPRKPAYINKLETRLREKLGTQVKVRNRKEGGAIEIIYYSSEDLDRLMDIFDQIKF